MKSFKLLAAFCLVFLAVSTSTARDLKKEIRFAPGSTSASLEGSVVRGDRDRIAITAKAGQTMTVTITAAEDNAVFQIYQPGARFVKKEGIDEVEGKALPGADEGEDAKSWRGALPRSGKYWIIVGGTRGNAMYTLTVTIK